MTAQPAPVPNGPWVVNYGTRDEVSVGATRTNLLLCTGGSGRGISVCLTREQADELRTAIGAKIRELG